MAMVSPLASRPRHAPPGQLLPTQDTLSSLLEQFLSVFGCAEVLRSRQLPAHPLQREHAPDDNPRYQPRPMSGNDFDIESPIVSAPSWEATLQLDGSDGRSSSRTLARYRHWRLQSPAGASLSHLKSVVALLDTHWPDAALGLSRRRQLGPAFADAGSGSGSGEYLVFQWLASKQLNPVYEGVSVEDLFVLDDWALLQGLREQAVKHELAAKESPAHEWKRITVTSPSVPGPTIPAAGQLWSFCGPAKWVISLPVLATLLLLTAHPDKATNPSALPSDCPDRDLSWCLDSLQGFCRLRGPEEGPRTLTSRFGTYPDHWVHLHFVRHSFAPAADGEDGDDRAAEWQGNGMRCERRSLALPVGRKGEEVRFVEQRVWTGLRAATGQDGSASSPGTVGFVVADSGHQVLEANQRSWAARGLEGVVVAQGVVFFQMLVWSGADDWCRRWTYCLDYLDRLHEPEIEELQDASGLYNKWMCDESGALSKAYFVTGHLLRIFRKHIDVFPAEVRRMEEEWQRAYPAVNLPSGDDNQRFKLGDRTKLLRNWSKVVAHVDRLHRKLVARIENRINELQDLRNSLLLEKISRGPNRGIQGRPTTGA